MSGVIVNRVPDGGERRVTPVLPAAAAEVRSCFPSFFQLSLVLNMSVFLIYSFRRYIKSNKKYLPTQPHLFKWAVLRRVAAMN